MEDNASGILGTETSMELQEKDIAKISGGLINIWDSWQLCQKDEKETKIKV